MADYSQTIRSYEISVWTLQDECITVLKPSELEFKGEVQNPIAAFVDDGTETLKFNIPMYYMYHGQQVLNPAWAHILDGHFTANMHKIKLIFNKATEDEQVYEMLITNVEQSHELDAISYAISCEGLAFHELGKLGYKISLSSDTFEREFQEWFENGSHGEAPHATIQYWNDKIFRYDGSYVETDNGDGTTSVVFEPGAWKYGWTYEIQMDWSGFSSGAARDPNKVYEEEYVSSWNVDPFDYNFSSASVEGYREKWRQMDEEESNIYNLTQAIAEKFGVYCRYEYSHDENYHITGRKVIYYNSSFKEQEGYTDLTYPYNAAKVTRNVDNTETITKLFVRPIESDSSSSNLISITNVEGNPSKEDYLLNFDYLHEVHTITDEQYEQVSIYEGKMREINEQAVRLETQIMLVQEELVKVRADYTTYTNAITLDMERANNAALLYQQLTGNLDYIEITAANPDILVLKKLNKNASSYYVDMPYEGIFPESVNLYLKLNYTKHEDDGRLEGLVTSGEMQFDEFNNLSRITNIYIPKDEAARVYMTCNYSPKVYYEKVEQIWKQRLASDTANQAKAEVDIRSLELLLYSADTDYCHADYAVADGGSVQVSVALEALRLALTSADQSYDQSKIDFNNRSMYMGETSKGTNVYHRGWEKETPDRIYERTPQAVSFVYGYDEDRFVVVNPVLPTGQLLNDGTTYTNPTARINGAQYMGMQLASQYAAGTIGLDTILPIPGNSYWKFSDIYICTAPSATAAQDICTAFYEYDVENITTSCAFEGNAVTDATYADMAVTESNPKPEQKGYTDKALADEAHGYCALYDFLLEKKYKIITNFEKWMGPALREGYWQADDYNDYGNKYADRFVISSNTKRIYDGSIKPELINFTWDTSNVFTGETEAYYEVDVNQNKEYYLLVDLRPYLYKLHNYTNDLCFIYYNETFLELNDKLRQEEADYNDLQQRSGLTHEELSRIIVLEYTSDLTTEETAELRALRARNHLGNNTEEMIKYKSLRAHKDYWADAIVRNEDAARRWFTIGSQCQFGYAYLTDNKITEDKPAVTGYIPVLILTGMKDLTVEERLSIVAPYEGYAPFLGTVKTNVETKKDSTGKQYSEVKTEIIHISDKELTFINTSGKLSKYDGNDKPRCEEIIAKTVVDENGEMHIETQHIPHTIKYINYGMKDDKEDNPDAVMAYPRIRVNSLDLKNNDSDILISLKGLNQADESSNTTGYRLQYIEDFYVLMKLDKADNTYKYFITIKPEVFIKYAQNRIPCIDINYTTSNANEAIYLDAVKVMKENAYPKVSYTVGLNAINPQMIRVAYKKLRTIVHINDYELQLDKTTGYISRVELDLDNPQNDVAEIKNYETKFEDLFSTIVAQSENMKKNENTISIAAAAFTPGGTLYSSILQESILKADLNYSFNQGKLTIDESNGIWGTSDSGVVAFRGGGIFTATERSEDGSWNWNTGILPAGINADLITSGQLDTNKIRVYAGDKVAFQINGEGIFAYKTYASDQNIKDMTPAEEALYKNADDDIDALQYVTYNENGLFFTTKSGTKYVNKAKTSYDTLTQDVNRVEISWEGLILRNWKNEETFWAEPDTGNLHLTGEIETESGHIGSWRIDKIGLTGSFIKLLNDSTNTDDNGIFLYQSASAGAKTVTYNDETYYAYKVKGDDSGKIYYLKAIHNGEYTLRSSDEILTYDPTRRSARPKYTQEDTITKDVQIGTKYDAGGNPVPITTTLSYKYTYVMNSNVPNDYMLLYGETKILFDGSTSLVAQWHRNVETLNKDTDTYITYTYVSELKNVKGSSKAPAVGTVLVLDSYQPTFSVKASTGYVTMNNGALGNFKLQPTYITGENVGELRQTKIMQSAITDSTIDGFSTGYGQLLKDVSGSSDGGWIKFTRVNGDTENFNVADMYYYKHNISAAQVINPISFDVHVDGTSSYVHAVAQTVQAVPHGSYYTRWDDCGVGQVYSAGWNAVTVDNITSTHNNSTLTATATASNGKSNSSSFDISDVYGNGQSAGASSVKIRAMAGSKTSYNSSSHVYHYEVKISLTNDVQDSFSGVLYANEAYEQGKVEGSAGGGTCFVKGTMIKLADGSSIPIEKLTVDTLLEAYDEDTEQFTTSAIKTVQVFNRPSSIISIYCESGDILTLTESHPILTNHGWAAYDVDAATREHTAVIVSQLTEQSEVLTINGWSKISKIEKRDDLDNPPVYNLDVEPVDTYIANNIVVHNADPKTN